MKGKSILVFILAVSIGLVAKNDSVWRVKAIGKAPPHITQKKQAQVAAFRAAKVEGYKRLATAAGFAHKYQLGNQNVIRIETYLTGAKVIDKRYISDYEVVVIMEMPKKQLNEQLAIVKKKITESNISEIKGKMKEIQAQIQKLNATLLELHERLKKMEEDVNEEI